MHLRPMWFWGKEHPVRPPSTGICGRLRYSKYDANMSDQLEHVAAVICENVRQRVKKYNRKPCRVELMVYCQSIRSDLRV